MFSRPRFPSPFLSSCLAALMLCLFSIARAGAAPKNRELIVGFKPAAAPPEKTRALRNTQEVRDLNAAGRAQRALAPNMAVLKLAPGVDPDAEIARLRQNQAVEFVEPNYALRLLDLTNAPVIPDDFDFSKMYALLNTGADGGKTNADIHATEAWRYATGSKKVIVAVIDTGIDYFHEDLKSNLWTNTKEIPFNGIDDDGNGFVDDYLGYDFVSGDSDPYDDNEHGTHVSGIIGAKGNNAIGIAGICWDVSIMPLKAFDEKGNGTVADAISAIHYAISNGARLINASWGLDEKSRALELAVQEAADAGVLMIAAAGNNRSDAPSYPASYESVLAVAASNNKDTRADFSNYGAYVDIAAPGADIYSTLPENSYGLLSGTSMAAPQVTGVAALVLSRFPNYSRQELFDILINSVDPVVFDQPVGNGRLNAARAVQMDQPLPTARLSAPATVSAKVAIAGTASGSYMTGYGVFAGSGRAPTNWIQIGSSTQPVTNALVAMLDSALLPDGAGVVQLVVTNSNGAAAVVNSPVRILNALITAPLAGDIIAPANYEIRGTVYGGGKSWQLFYGAGLNPSQWIPIPADGAGQVVDGTLAHWDASKLPTGIYSLRLVTTDGDAQSEFLAPAIFIDQQLKPGWPVYIPADADFPPADWRNIRAADLDGDGKSEIILVDAGTRTHPQTLLVYSNAGQLLWSRELGFDIPPDLPAIGDMDGDGKLEIFVDGPNGILAFRHDGTPFGPGWPVPSSTSNHAKVLADLDGDGKLELISFSQEYSATQVAETRELAVYNSAGELLRSWALPWCGSTNDVEKIFPAVANLDDDPELEIVAVSGCSQIAAYDFRRAEPKWFASLDATVLSSPVIGDVDGNGSPDIVVAAAAESGAAAGGIYIFDARGQRWRGWPVLEEYSFSAAPALADLDKDGRLEIILPSTSPEAMHVVQWDGFEADGWPQEIFTRSTPRLGATVADVNGDGFSDIVLPALGYMNLAVTQNNTDYIGGVQAFDFSGRIIPLNGTSAIPGLPIEGQTSDRWRKAAPALLGDFDGNGILDLAVSSIQERTYGSLAKIKGRSGIYLRELRGTASVTPPEWPMLGHDPANSGRYSLPLPPIVIPTNVTRAIRDRVITGEDRALRIEPLTNDWNAALAPLALVSFTQPTNGSVQFDGPAAVLYTPATNYSGLDGFSYVIRDAGGLSSTGSVVIRIKPVNYAPVAKDLQFTMQKNTSLDLFYDGADVERDPLTFRALQSPEHGELWSYPTVATYYPAKGFSGTDSFTYVANDGKHDSLPASVTITILNSNNPPVAIAQSLLTKTNRAVSITPRGQDPDDDPLTFELVSLPESGSITNTGANFRYTPAKDYLGEASFTIRAFDGTAWSDPARITIGVIATNARPRANPATFNVPPNTVSPVAVSGVDPDGDRISYAVVLPPLHGTLSGTAPSLSYTPATNFTGPDRFTFKVADGFDESDPVTVSLQVSRQNRPPKSADQTVSTSAGAPLKIPLSGSDPDGDAVESVILKGPGNGLLFGRGTNLTYIPNPGAIGNDLFTYKLWDGQKFGNVAQVTVEVTPARQDQAPAFLSVQPGTDGVDLTLSIPNTRPFVIQSSTNLLDWATVSETLSTAESSLTWRDTNAPPASLFYRALRQN